MTKNKIIRISNHKLELGHLDKKLWPKSKIAKGDLIDYYQKISNLILPYLNNRPVTVLRCPDGVSGECWIQKEAPTNRPRFVKTHSILAKSTGKIVHYILINNLETLLWLVNLGAIEFHIWLSKVGQKNPDWIIFDLDLAQGNLSDLIILAFIIKKTMEKDGYQPHVKSTGKTGLHILIKNRQKLSYRKAREYVHQIAENIAKKNPQLLTLETRVKDRKAKCYLDPAQNARGRHIIASFSVRATDYFSVSMPIEWGNLKNFKYQKLSIKEYLAKIFKIKDWL